MIESIYIDLGNIEMIETSPDWLTGEWFPALLDLVLKQTIVVPKYEGDRLKKISTVSNLQELVRKRSKKSSFSLNLYSEKDTEGDCVSLYFNTWDAPSIRLSISKRSKVEQEDLEQGKEFMLQVVELCKGFAYFGPSISISFFADFNYPTLRPPRYMRFFGEHDLVNLFDHRYFERHPDNWLIKQSEVKAMLKGIEGKVEVKNEGDFSLVNWGKSVDFDALQKALSQKEDLVCDLVEFTPKDGFTEEGDKKIINVSSLEKLEEEHEFFSYYYARGKMAFKMLTLDAAGKIDNGSAKQLKHFAESGTLNDSRPINKILVVLPGRKYMAQIDAQAKDLGVYKLLYLDDEVNLWDTNPGGNWKN